MTAPTETGDLAEYEEELAATPPGRTPLVIKLLVAATFVVILNETIMANAVPSLMADLEITERAAGWLTTVFLLTMAAVIPVTGWFLQRVSTRAAYATAMSVFCAGTLLAGLAPSFEVLLVARVVQAAGTAVMMPLLMTTLMTVVSPADRGRVMGNVTLVMSVAPAMGPAVSGVILQLGSWRLIFLLVLPLAALVAVAGLRQLPNVGEPAVSRLDWISVILATAGFAALVYGLSEMTPHGWKDALPWAIGGAVLVLLFALRQVRLIDSGTPLLDLRAFRERNFTFALIVLATGFMAMIGAMLLLPLYLQNEAFGGMTPLQSGLMVMPGGIAMGLLGPRVGRLYDRVGSRPLVIPGAVVMLVTLGLFSRIQADTPFWMILVLHVAMMVALSFIFTPTFTVGLGALPPHLYSHGSSLLGTLQQVAGALGAALVMLVLASRQTALAESGAAPLDALIGGFQWAFLAGALMAVVVVAFTLLLPSKVDAPEGAVAPH